MRLALYARCSTTEQSVDLQRDALRDYASTRGFQLAGEYVDEGVSGARARRPALDRLLVDAHRRRFDAVLVWKLDRLGRSLSHLVRLLDQFAALGVDLVSLNDPGLDTTSPQGKLIFAVMAAVAEFERELVRERTRAGMAAARRRGKRIGRPPVRVDRLELDAGLQAGESISALARRLEVSRTVVRRELEALGLYERVTTGDQNSSADPHPARPG